MQLTDLSKLTTENAEVLKLLMCEDRFSEVAPKTAADARDKFQHAYATHVDHAIVLLSEPAGRWRQSLDRLPLADQFWRAAVAVSLLQRASWIATILDRELVSADPDHGEALEALAALVQDVDRPDLMWWWPYPMVRHDWTE